jgi:hypothetical protein
VYTVDRGNITMGDLEAISNSNDR